MARSACLAGPPYAPCPVVFCRCSDLAVAPQENQTVFLLMGSPLHAWSRWGTAVFFMRRPGQRGRNGMCEVCHMPVCAYRIQGLPRMPAVLMVLCVRCLSATLRARSIISPLKFFRLLLLLAHWCSTGVPGRHFFVFFWARNLHFMSDVHVLFFVRRCCVCRNSLPPCSGCRMASRLLYFRA